MFEEGKLGLPKILLVVGVVSIAIALFLSFSSSEAVYSSDLLLLVVIFLFFGGIVTAIFGILYRREWYGENQSNKEYGRLSTTSGKGVPTMVLIILPIILMGYGMYVGFSTPYTSIYSLGDIFVEGLIVITAISAVYGLYPAPFSIPKAINEFQYLKKILLVEISVVAFLFIATNHIVLTYVFPPEYWTSPRPQFFMAEVVFVTLLAVVPGGLLRLVFQIVRKEFRFYFAKGCFSLMAQKEEEFEKMSYLKLGLDSYNKYLRRRFKYQISDNNIKKFYFKYIRATFEEKNEMINSLLEAFENGSSKPVMCMSTIMKVPETEEFLTLESVGQRLKVVGTFLAATIPILVSVIDLVTRAIK